MLFQTLLPLVTERPIHLLLSVTADGKMRVYIEPKPTSKDEQGPKASLSPLACTDTAEALDAKFAATLTEWLSLRSEVMADINAGLAAAKANLAAAAKEDKSKATKSSPASKSVSKSVAVKPSAQVKETPPARMVDATSIGSTSNSGDLFPLAVGGGPAAPTSTTEPGEGEDE